jgi:predicted transcriptional regulator
MDMITEKHGKKVLFLSLSPERATALINKEIKTIIKQDAPEVQKGDIVLIYAGSPVEQIIGSCTVESVAEGKYSKLVKQFGSKTDIGMDIRYRQLPAFAITLKNATPMYKPITLNEIKTLLPGFAPPKTFKHFTYSQFINLMNTSIKYAAIS